MFTNTEIAKGRANTVFENVKQLLTEKHLDVFIGAAVMTERCQGNVKKLREEFKSELLGLHYKAHRLVFAASDAARSVKR